MAQTNFTPILTYKSDTATSIPSAGNLTNSANGAELAVNTADKRLFTKDSGGNVVELGTNPSSVTLPNGTANGVVYANGSKVLTTGSALVFDGSNLGLGVTPSAWFSPSARAIDFTFPYVGMDTNGAGVFGFNAYNSTGSTWIYKSSDEANRFSANIDGSFTWHIAPSGTAGNAIPFSQVMTLNASGQFLLGSTTAPSGSTARTLAYNAGVGAGHQVAGPSNNGGYLQIALDGGGYGFLTYTGAIGSESYTERARIDSSGNLLCGLTATAGYLDGRLNVQAAGTQPGICAKTDPAGSTTQFVYSAWAPFNSGNNVFMSFETETSATIRGSISYNRGAGLVAYNTTSDYRAKDILGPIENSGSVIDSVPVYIGKMKGATQERPMFIAHETPAYAHTGEKDAVDEDGNPIFQQMDASALIPVMWAEIQSLRARVAALESNP